MVDFDQTGNVQKYRRPLRSRNNPLLLMLILSLDLPKTANKKGKVSKRRASFGIKSLTANKQNRDYKDREEQGPPIYHKRCIIILFEDYFKSSKRIVGGLPFGFLLNEVSSFVFSQKKPQFFKKNFSSTTPPE
jgi:hypothetical protein